MKFATIGYGGDTRLLEIARRNLGELPTDPQLAVKSRTISIVRGPHTAAEVLALAIQLRDEIGYRLPQKQSTVAAEIVFGMPAHSDALPPGYMMACLDWVDETFGERTILSAVMHLSKDARMQVLMLPVRHGTWMKSKVFGGRAGVRSLQEAFHDCVASRFGFAKPAPIKLPPLARRMLARQIVQHLAQEQDPCTTSAVWKLVKARIESDPLPFAQELGLNAQRPPVGGRLAEQGS
jgi:hypothetical protein